MNAIIGKAVIIVIDEVVGLVVVVEVAVAEEEK